MCMPDNKKSIYKNKAFQIMAEQNFKILFYLTVYTFVMKTLLILQQIYYYSQKPRKAYLVYIGIYICVIGVTVVSYVLAKINFAKKQYKNMTKIYNIFVVVSYILVLLRTVFDIFKLGTVESFIGTCVELSFLYIAPEIYMPIFAIVTPIIYAVLIANYGFSISSSDIIINNIIIIFAIMVFSMMKYRNREMAIMKQLEAEDLYQKDALSNLYNRLSLNKYIEEVGKKSIEGGILLDIDNFKSVNDTYGHLAGDKVIEEIGEVLNSYNSNLIRTFRYGGEEFLVLIKNIDEKSPYDIAEEIRKKISALTFDEFNVTASLGAFNNKDDKLETIKAISLSDELLYKAKNSGKNKTETNM